jgi:hypothetical protein
MAGLDPAIHDGAPTIGGDTSIAAFFAEVAA